MRYAIALAGLLLLVGSAPQSSSLSFTDITTSAGTGGPASATGGHGAMFADATGDGRPDLYITMIWNNPMPDLFFRNKGNNQFADEGASRGIDDYDGGSHGACWADLDNDGDYDLFNGTTWIPSNSNNVFRNDGSGFFTDVTPSVIRNRQEVTRGVLTFDMDGDGDLDLFCVTNYQGSNDPAGEKNEIYRNDGGFSFTAVSGGALETAPAGQGAIDTDYDGDGDIDVFAANRTGDVNILRNNGSGNFTKIAPSSIGISHRAGDGITTADIDNDGDLDLLLAGDNVGRLYRNTGGGNFTYLRQFSNTDGYMGAFGDLDNDGDLDLVFAGDNVSYLNDGSGAFSTGPSVPVSGINDPRGNSFADIDGDGDLDIAVGCKRSRNWLLRNNFNGGNWLKIRLTAPNGQAGAFGAKTRIFSGGTLLGLRESRSNYGYLGQDDPVLHFGLGSRTSVDVEVTFLDGTKVTRSNVAANQTLSIQGSGSPLNASPQCSITAPPGGATYPEPATIRIDADASDSDGTILRVEFFSNGTMIGADTTAPYSYTWNNVGAGSYSLTAKATDDDGAVTTSPPVSVTVNAPPSPPGLVSGLTVGSGEAYEWFTLTAGENLYIDRTYTYSSPVPPLLDGQVALRTANDDKASPATTPDFVAFTVNQNATVLVLYTLVNTTLETDWLNGTGGWGAEGFTVATTLAGAESDRRVRSRFFAGGSLVELGGNGATSGTSSMYTVVVVPGDVTGVTDADGDGLPDSWENANFGDLSQTPGGDFDGDGLTNGEEFTAGTDPTLQDTDGDGFDDGIEMAQGTDPLDASSYPGSGGSPGPSGGGSGGCGATGLEVLAILLLRALRRRNAVSN